MRYPISINTDDRGIFDSSLTKELLHVKDAMALDLADIVQILGQHSITFLAHRLVVHQPYICGTTRCVFYNCSKCTQQLHRFFFTGSTIDQTFATDAEKEALKKRFWTTVQQLVGENKDAALFRPPKKANVKDMQDMSYLLYI